MRLIIDRLIDKIDEKQNPTCVGLDTNLGHLPRGLKDSLDIKTAEEAAKAILKYNMDIIDAVYDIVPAVKVQIAYYEMLGIEGLSVFKKTISYAKAKDLIVITDAKRNDIGSTSAAYSNAHLGKTILGSYEYEAFPTDIMTINPYLGTDGVQPFLDDCKKYGKGLYVLVKTSNPSSSELQDLVLTDGRRVYEATADLVLKWASGLKGAYGYSSIGAVIGATHKKIGESLRERMKGIHFLLPGYGAQGATGADLAGMFDENGRGAIVNASRSILSAHVKAGTEDYAAAARAEAKRMQQDIWGALKAQGKV